MSADLAARLRSLAQDHQAGRLSLTAYRKLRAPLLDSLALHGACDADEKTQPRAVARAQDSGSANAAPQQSPGEARAKRYAQAAIAFAVVLAIAGGAFWVLRHPASEETGSVASRETKGPVQEVIEPFVARGDWSDAHTATLNAALLELGRQRIADAATEPWFQGFVHDLRKRLKEQQALTQAPLAAQTSPLAALAVTVGIDLNSPEVAISVTTPAEPASVASSTATPIASPTEKSSAPAAPKPSNRAPLRTDEAPRESEPNVAVADTPSVSAASVTTSAPNGNACRLELIRTRRPFCRDQLASGEDGPELALIPASAVEVRREGSSEASAQWLNIQKPFAMAVHEVSQGEFLLYCRHSGKSCAEQPWAGDDYPVVNVSWQDARDYATWLSQATGQEYRLPSESEWEYAARAGQSEILAVDGALSPTDVHYSMLAKQEAPARRSQKFNDNGFRLLHTLGNVREWIGDADSSDTRIARGGSYADTAAKLKSSTREELPANTRDAFTGFRIVRELP